MIYKLLLSVPKFDVGIDNKTVILASHGESVKNHKGKEGTLSTRRRELLSINKEHRTSIYVASDNRDYVRRVWAKRVSAKMPLNGLSTTLIHADLLICAAI